MVKSFLKSIVLHADELSYYSGNFPSIYPKQIASLYKDYYAEGTGFVIVCLILFIVLFEALFSEKIQRYCAKTLILILSFFYLGTSALRHNGIEYPLNILYTPILNISPLLLYIVLLSLYLPLHISFFNRLKVIVSYKIYKFVRISTTVLFILLLLPVFTGELWQI